MPGIYSIRFHPINADQQDQSYDREAKDFCNVFYYINLISLVLGFTTIFVHREKKICRKMYKLHIIQLYLFFLPCKELPLFFLLFHCLPVWRSFSCSTYPSASRLPDRSGIEVKCVPLRASVSSFLSSIIWLKFVSKYFI